MALNRLMFESVPVLPCGLCTREQYPILQIFSIVCISGRNYCHNFSLLHNRTHI